MLVASHRFDPVYSRETLVVRTLACSWRIDLTEKPFDPFEDRTTRCWFSDTHDIWYEPAACHNHCWTVPDTASVAAPKSLLNEGSRHREGRYVVERVRAQVHGLCEEVVGDTWALRARILRPSAPGRKVR